MRYILKLKMWMYQLQIQQYRRRGILHFLDEESMTRRDI